ncbi:MAG: hypothetical protein U0165_05220 [Polyangiaceae bacterium]
MSSSKEGQRARSGPLGAGAESRFESVETPAEPGQERVDQNGVILVSGGARGVTAAAVVALAKEHRPSVVLLGRTPLDAELLHAQG